MVRGGGWGGQSNKTVQRVKYNEKRFVYLINIIIIIIIRII